MKLVLAIINYDDANAVTHALTKKGFSSTKLATTGGFLMAGNVTILIGVDEEKVQTVIDIIKEHSHSRKQMIPTTTEMSYGYYPSMPVEVTVGGATVFVVDVERFERLPPACPTPIFSVGRREPRGGRRRTGWPCPMCVRGRIPPAASARAAGRRRRASTRTSCGWGRTGRT